nr:unnamed protein product [Fasciola hepatica]
MSYKTNKMKPIIFLIVILCVLHSQQADGALILLLPNQRTRKESQKTRKEKPRLQEAPRDSPITWLSLNSHLGVLD